MEIKFNNADISQSPTRHGTGWFDIFTADKTVYKAGDIVKINFELIIELPEGYEAIIAPRSSTLERYGLLFPSIGIIDNEYRGKNDEIGARFYAVMDGYVPPNTAICQMKIVENMSEYIKFTYQTKDKFSDSDRGGFGSTDKGKSFEDKSLYTLYTQGHEDGYEKGYEEGYDIGFLNGIHHAVDNKITAEELKNKFKEKKSCLF